MSDGSIRSSDLNYIMNKDIDDGSNDKNEIARKLALFYVLKQMKDNKIINFTKDDEGEYNKLEKIFKKQNASGVNFDEYVKSGVWSYFQEILEDTRRRLKSIDTVEQHQNEINHIFLKLLKLHNVPIDTVQSSEYMGQFVDYILDKVVPQFERNIREYDSNGDNKIALCNAVASEFYPGACAKLDSITSALTNPDNSSNEKPNIPDNQGPINYAFLTPKDKKVVQKAKKDLEHQNNEFLKAIEELKKTLNENQTKIDKTLEDKFKGFQKETGEKNEKQKQEVLAKITELDTKFDQVNAKIEEYKGLYEKNLESHNKTIETITTNSKDTLDSYLKGLDKNNDAYKKDIQEHIATIKKLQEDMNKKFESILSKKDSSISSELTGFLTKLNDNISGLIDRARPQYHYPPINITNDNSLPASGNPTASGSENVSSHIHALKALNEQRDEFFMKLWDKVSNQTSAPATPSAPASPAQQPAPREDSNDYKSLIEGMKTQLDEQKVDILQILDLLKSKHNTDDPSETEIQDRMRRIQVQDRWIQPTYTPSTPRPDSPSILPSITQSSTLQQSKADEEHFARLFDALHLLYLMQHGQDENSKKDTADVAKSNNQTFMQELFHLTDQLASKSDEISKIPDPTKEDKTDQDAVQTLFSLLKNIQSHQNHNNIPSDKLQSLLYFASLLAKGELDKNTKATISAIGNRNFSDLMYLLSLFKSSINDHNIMPEQKAEEQSTQPTPASASTPASAPTDGVFGILSNMATRLQNNVVKKMSDGTGANQDIFLNLAQKHIETQASSPLVLEAETQTSLASQPQHAQAGTQAGTQSQEKHSVVPASAPQAPTQTQTQQQQQQQQQQQEQQQQQQQEQQQQQQQQQQQEQKPPNQPNKIKMFYSLVKLLTLLHQIMEKKETATEESQAGGKYSHTQGMQGGSVFDDNNYKLIKQLQYDIVERYIKSFHTLNTEFKTSIEEYKKIESIKYADDPIVQKRKELQDLEKQIDEISKEQKQDDQNNNTTDVDKIKANIAKLGEEIKQLEEKKTQMKEVFELESKKSHIANMQKNIEDLNALKVNLSSIESKINNTKPSLITSIKQLKTLIDELYKNILSKSSILPYNEDIKDDIKKLYEDLDNFSTENNDHKLIIEIIKFVALIQNKTRDIDTTIKKLQTDIKRYERDVNDEVEYKKLDKQKNILASPLQYAYQDGMSNTMGTRQRLSFTQSPFNGGANEEMNLQHLNNLKTHLTSLYNNLKEFNDTSVRSNASILKIPSLYENIWNEYVKLKKYYRQENKLPVYADDMLHDKIKLYNLDPAKVLKITFEDKVIFIALIFIVRLIIVILLELFIDYNIIRTLHYAMIFYAIIYIFIIIVLILIINYDSYKLRILVNYMNLHINSTKIFMHILLFILFIALVYMMIKSQDTLDIFGNLFDFTNVYKHLYELTETTQEQSDVRLSQSEKLKLQYRIDIITMIVFIFCGFLILVV